MLKISKAEFDSIVYLEKIETTPLYVTRFVLYLPSFKFMVVERNKNGMYFVMKPPSDIFDAYLLVSSVY